MGVTVTDMQTERQSRHSYHVPSLYTSFMLDCLSYLISAYKDAMISGYGERVGIVVINMACG